MKIKHRLWTALMASLASAILYAQASGAGLQGKIKASGGQPVRNATLRIQNGETDAVWTVTTDDAGRYRAPSLPPGRYEVRVTADGYAALTYGGVTLTVGQDAILDLSLAVDQEKSTRQQEEWTETAVSMTANDGVNVTSGAASGMINDRQIRDLPLNGRSFQQLAALQPGVTVAYAAGNDVTGRTPKLSINGGRPESVSFLLDGTNINNVTGKTPGSPLGLLLGVEGVLEFRVMASSYSAEFGRGSGGAIQAATRWGGNQHHGSAYEFLRNSAMDAKNYFDHADDAIPPLKRNQFGGAVGGPIRKEKTFFFFAFESLIERLGITGVTMVPDAAARQGVIGGKSVALNPAVPAYLGKLFPMPNGPSLGNGVAQYLFSRSQPSDERYLTGRVDHRLRNGDPLFVRYSFDNGSVHRIPYDKAPVAEIYERSRNQYATVEHQHLLRPSLLNTARVGFNRSTTEAENVRTTDIDSLAFVPGQPFGFITIGGIVTELGGDYRLPRADRWNSYQAEDSLLYLRGAHSVRFGVQVEQMRENQSAVMSKGGLVRFADLENFLTGTPYNVDVTLPPGFLPNDRSSWERSFHQTLTSAYVQHDARVKENLMLNLGARYEFATVPAETHGRTTILPSFGATSLVVGQPMYNSRPVGNFAPRVGLAWDPFGKKRTAIRAGFGIFYDELTYKYSYYGASTNAPFSVRTSIANPQFPQVLTGFDPSKMRLTVQDIDRDPHTPYMAQFNLSLQQAVRDWTVTAAYVGSRGIHLIRQADANLAPWTVTNGVKTYQPSFGRMNPAFGPIVERATDARSFYNALQLTAAKRLSHGVRTQVNYTFSRSVDDSSGLNIADFDNSVQFGIDYYDRLRDRGLSSFHAAHNLSMNWTADLPFAARSRGLVAAIAKGWQLNNITTYQSGHPFTVTMSFNRSGNLNSTSFINERPNVKPGYTGNAVLGDPSRYWDINAFELPPANQMGNLGRNTLIGPSVLMIDGAAVKRVYSGERSNIQFRAEVFNLLNRPNFATPSGRTSFTSAAGAIAADAGRITSTVTTSRQIQLSLKLNF